MSEHLGSLSHSPHLAGAFEICCRFTVGAEVHALSREAQLWVPPGSACWGTLTSFAFSLEVYPLDVTIDFSLSSCFMAIHFSDRIPSPLGQLQTSFFFVGSTLVWGNSHFAPLLLYTHFTLTMISLCSAANLFDPALRLVQAS